MTGEYFTSADLSGSPALTRVDPTVNFNWDKAKPVPALPRDHFSVRWTGWLVPPGPGDYQVGARINACFGCAHPDHIRLHVDDRQVLDSLAAGNTVGAASFQAAVHCEDTRPHAIRLEYFHGDGSAGIDLTWQAPAGVLQEEALKAARAAEVIVALVGLSPNLEGEEMRVTLEGFKGGDRTSIELPASQEALLSALEKTGRPLVVVLQNGSALALGGAAGQAGTLLEAWYPGEEGGTAIAETLAGDSNPGGRLPVTFHAATSQLPDFNDYRMAGRTYRTSRAGRCIPSGTGSPTRASATAACRPRSRWPPGSR